MRQLILENYSTKNGLIQLEKKEYKYLRQVLRVKVGDMMNVRLNQELLSTTVAQIDDKEKKIILQKCANTNEKTITRGVQATQTSEILQNREYWLFQFIPRPQKFEQIVRQATECGISKIIPIIGEFSEKSSILALQNGKKERLEKIIREARQQSGSPIETKVFLPQNLEDAVNLWENENQKKLGIVLSERNENSKNLRDLVSTCDFKTVCIVVGSEGGISPNEINILTQKELFYPVHFAVNILRCETAALYGIAAIQSALNF